MIQRDLRRMGGSEAIRLSGRQFRLLLNPSAMPTGKLPVGAEPVQHQGPVASPALVGAWDLRGDSISVAGALPASLMEAFPTYMQYGHLEIIPWQGGYLAQIPTLGALQLLDSSGAVVGEVPLPAVRRRGQTGDLLVRQQQREADGDPFTHLGSAAATLGVLSTGEVISIQVDIDTERTAQGREFRNLRYYVSILSPDLRRACLDALVPFTSDAPFPIPHLMGDTLVTLSRVVGADDSVRIVVYRFTISSRGCVWVTL